jgi:hypothetical protein
MAEKSEKPERLMAGVVKMSVTIPSEVHHGLSVQAAAAGRELPEQIQWILTKAALPDMNPEAAARQESAWRIVDGAVRAAQSLCREGKFSRSITLDAIRRCKADADWLSDYKAVVGEDIYRTGNPRKAINREIGFHIRRGIGGTVEMKGNKPAQEKVLGEIIQSYTPMTDFDPNRVAAR